MPRKFGPIRSFRGMSLISQLALVVLVVGGGMVFLNSGGLEALTSQFGGNPPPNLPDRTTTTLPEDTTTTSITTTTEPPACASDADHDPASDADHDHNPSLKVDVEKGRWHCFPCGEGGDGIALNMKVRRQSFVEAVRELARMNIQPTPSTET